MFPAFLPFFKRSHADSSAESANPTIAKLTASVSEVAASLAANPTATPGLTAELLTDVASLTETATSSDRPAKYLTFAARITRIVMPIEAAEEFTLMAPPQTEGARETPQKNSYEQFVARLPESARGAIGEMTANKPPSPFTTPAQDDPTSPPIEPPQTRGPSPWGIPPLR